LKQLKTTNGRNNRKFKRGVYALGVLRCRTKGTRMKA